MANEAININRTLIVTEDLNLGTGTVEIQRAGSGTVTGTQINIESLALGSLYYLNYMILGDKILKNKLEIENISIDNLV